MVGAHARNVLEMTYNKLSNIVAEDLVDEFGHAHCRTVSHCHKCDRRVYAIRQQKSAILPFGNFPIGKNQSANLPKGNPTNRQPYHLANRP